MDLFINYDCDFAAASIFERMVNTCVKIAQGKHLHLPPPSGLMSLASAAGFDSRAEAKSQEQRLRLRALYVLVAVVMSLVGWTSDLASNVNVFQAMPGTVKESGKSSPQAEDPMPVFVDKRPMRGIKLSSVRSFPR